MGRALLVLVLAAAIGWLVLRLLRTLGQVLPGEGVADRAEPKEERKIIDAEFEDVTKEETPEA